MCFLVYAFLTFFLFLIIKSGGYYLSNGCVKSPGMLLYFPILDEARSLCPFDKMSCLHQP